MDRYCNLNIMPDLTDTSELDSVFDWYGMVYVQDGIIRRGAVTRVTGEGKWQAVRYDGVDAGYAPLGDCNTVEEAKAAVERACK